jgi:hypothetical protein
MVISSVRKEQTIIECGHSTTQENMQEKDSCVGPSRARHKEANRAMDFEIFSRDALEKQRKAKEADAAVRQERD